MRGLKLQVNGQEQLAAGHKDAVSFLVQVVCSPKSERVDYHVTGHFRRKGQEVPDYVVWKNDTVAENDEISIQLTELTEVDTPGKTRPTTHAWNADGSLELSCSFCGNVKSDLKYLITGSSGNICSDCVGLAVEILRDEKIPLGEA